MPRILVVDDEPDVRLIARVVLSSAGHDIVEAADGEAALEVVEHDPVDVMLLDVRMPGISGWEVLRRLRGTPQCLPVVVFTADVAAQREAPVEMEANELFIAKPFDPDDLIGTVQRALDGSS